MATNWTTQNKASTTDNFAVESITKASTTDNFTVETITKASATDNFSVETITKASSTDNWCAWGVGSVEREICGISLIEDMHDKWESMSSNYWETMGLPGATWTFSDTAVARDSD